MMTRRFLLAAVAVTAGASLLPAPLAAQAAPAIVPAAPLPAWCVGTSDEFNWSVIRAATAEEAILEWRQEASGLSACACAPGEEGDCEFCRTGDTDAVRTPSIDTIPDPKPGDWIRAGLGAYCARCNNEAFAEGGAIGLGDEAICEDCIEPEDWKDADPARYAELMADAEEAA